MLKTFPKNTLALILPALFLLAGCLSPDIFKKDAFAIDDWQTWTSWNDDYGSHSLSGSKLVYMLGEKQDDTQDMPFDGRLPGLILAKSVQGRSWRVEVSPKFKIPAGPLKRFSFGVWLGREDARPSLGSPAAVLRLLVQRQNGPAPEDDVFLVSAPPVKDAPVKIPNETKILRFEKSGGYFFISYSLDGKEFRLALRAASKEANEAESQQFFISGRADGHPNGARAEFINFEIRGQ